MIFVDTSAFLALTDSSDQYNRQALSTWRGLLEKCARKGCQNLYGTRETHEKKAQNSRISGLAPQNCDFGKKLPDNVCVHTLENNETLVCNNYVLVESIALIQRRTGLEAVQVLQTQIVPFLDVEWFDQEFHDATVNLVLAMNRRKLSFVDCSSFTTMRRLGIQSVFTFDDHFREEGFTVVPNASSIA